jgi:hypothetical protein
LFEQIQFDLFDLWPLAEGIPQGLRQSRYILGTRLRQPVGRIDFHRRQLLREASRYPGFEGLSVLGEGVLGRWRVLLAQSDFFLAPQRIVPGGGPLLRLSLVVLKARIVGNSTH